MTKTNKNQKHKHKHKHRGFWPTFWLVFFGLQSIFYIFLINDFLSQTGTIDKPLILGGLIILTIADLVGLLGIWLWKKWGWYVYLIAAAGSIILGLVATGNWLAPLHEIMPFVILGWVYRGKTDNFD